ncbi:hypothetical protein TNCV_4993261 [Trichonephila clavipes]|nr:hypothetical protein TNCV_4993261 [Trichonephila clavipes]
MPTGSSLTQNYSRSQSEIQGDLHTLAVSLKTQHSFLVMNASFGCKWWYPPFVHVCYLSSPVFVRYPYFTSSPQVVQRRFAFVRCKVQALCQEDRCGFGALNSTKVRSDVREEEIALSVEGIEPPSLQSRPRTR